MAKFHVNAAGELSPCSAQISCPFGGEEVHFEGSRQEAQEKFEAALAEEYSILTNTSKAPVKHVLSFDNRISAKLEQAEAEFSGVEDKQKWINNRVDAYELSKNALNRTLPGTPERFEAMRDRAEARENLLVADIAAWRDSDFYNPDVESRLKESAVAVSDADSSLEQALADKPMIAEVARENGIATSDVENILEVTQENYLRTRGALSSHIVELSDNELYARDTAYVFRVEPAKVKSVLAWAGSYSNVAPPQRDEDDDFNLGFI